MNRRVAVLVVVWLLVGCSAQPPDRLTATLVKPTEILLAWQNFGPETAGQVVEFATEPDGAYTILGFLVPGENRYTHPELMPQTPFYYRVRPYFGSASRTVDVVLPDGEFTEQDAQGAHDWTAPRTLPGGPVPTELVHGGGTPGDFTATVKHANGIWFTWVDRTSDEEGFLLEISAEGGPDFRVAAVVDPNINSYGLITLPEEKRASYRVRAFHYGPGSNVAHKTTGR